MTLHRHAISALVLFVGGAVLAPVVSPAEGAFIRRGDLKSVANSYRVTYSVIVDNDPNSEVASVELRVSSDGGNEALALTESDAWLHGSAALSALPAKDAALTLTLYDKGNASLMTFSGTLTTDGAVTLEAKSAETYCDKLGCTSIEPGDVEVLSAEVYPSGKGYALTLDLTGADTYEVAYATLEVSGGDKAEVDWDSVGSVWTAESTLEHSGVIDVRAKVLDAEGNAVENVKAELAEPWLDGGEGVNALSAGAGTSVAILSGETRKDQSGVTALDGNPFLLTVVSDGWTTTAYPTHAELELAGGETVTVPANSYQRKEDRARREFYEGLISEVQFPKFDATITVTGGDFVAADYSILDLRTPVCSSGICVVLVEAEKGYDLSFTAYGTNPAKLPEKQDFSLVLYDAKGTKVASETRSVEFHAEVAAVFASGLDMEGDPMGGDASGSVSLLGAADTKGKQATLSKGTFYGSFSRDAEGDLGLGGYGTDDWATSETSADVLLGDPVEASDDEGPPVVLFNVGGKITKLVINSGGLGYDAF